MEREGCGCHAQRGDTAADAAGHLRQLACCFGTVHDVWAFCNRDTLRGYALCPVQRQLILPFASVRTHTISACVSYAAKP
jgi:hypothetical protein